MKSVGFSSFRELMDLWDEALIEQDQESKINALLDNGEFILFFEKDGDIFGADENSRVILAKLKNPDDDLPSGWEEEANFAAQNLSKTVQGESSQHVFGHNDLDEIKIIDRDAAFDRLKKQIGGEDFSASQPVNKAGNDPDQASNFIQTKER